MNPDTTAYVQWFRQSSPYINAHRGKTFVVMFEGDAIVHPNFTNVVQDIALLNSLGVRLVLVHGARPQIDTALRRLGAKSAFHRDLRITDDQALTAVKAAVGYVKADIESKMSVGLPNTPMYGARMRVVSGNFVIARPLGVIDGIDFQHTGEVRRVDHSAISDLLAGGNVVLLSCLGYSPSGEVFNLAVEDVAQHTAVSLRADKLILMGGYDGLVDSDGNSLPEVTCGLLEQVLHSYQGEARNHSEAALKAVSHGVPRAHLVSYQNDGALLEELFTREGMGTMISQDPYDHLRPARIEDVGGILELLRPLEEAGILVRRSRELLETELNRFYVIERDGMITACSALYPYSDDRAELACVAVHPDYRGSSRGRQLLEQIEQEARRRQYKQLFVLTTRTAHWFVEHGFVAGAVTDLPEERQKLYNFQRNSKVFLKSLQN
ncbi:amino-acid N-acetyltransferase [Oceanobacter mangrovi]|uniref:amino-acid N-acetyltransferase n=1 Tax=Oceanobacter mangrovi TaxID=2862510 RepID=UPI001C8D3400|nr:amino-acid N-acetyltransferase [Oceanobacter mangrovi]